jgi:hypothetical protein
MKDKTAKFLKSNYVTIILYFGLFLIAIGNSIIGAIVYGLISHAMLLGLIVGLYKPKYIEEVDDLIKKLKASKSYVVRAKLRLIAHCIFSVCVLGIYDQLYLATITIALYALLYVYTVDADKTAKKSLEELEKL